MLRHGIHRADQLIDRVLAEAATCVPAEAVGAPGDEPVDENDFLNVQAIDTTPGAGWRRIGRPIYKHLMNGVSHMLPFVVGGGVLIATSFLFGIYSVDPASDEYNPFAEMLMTVGGLGLGLMVPVLSAFIASSIASRHGLTIGLTTGLLASAMGTGFLGGIATGFLSGYGMLLLAKLLSGLPNALFGLKAIFLFPVLGTFSFGGITYLISSPMAAISTGLQDVLASFQGATPYPPGRRAGRDVRVGYGRPGQRPRT